MSGPFEDDDATRIQPRAVSSGGSSRRDARRAGRTQGGEGKRWRAAGRGGTAQDAARVVALPLGPATGAVGSPPSPPQGEDFMQGESDSGRDVGTRDEAGAALAPRGPQQQDSGLQVRHLQMRAWSSPPLTTPAAREDADASPTPSTHTNAQASSSRRARSRCSAIRGRQTISGGLGARSCRQMRLATMRRHHHPRRVEPGQSSSASGRPDHLGRGRGLTTECRPTPDRGPCVRGRVPPGCEHRSERLHSGLDRIASAAHPQPNALAREQAADAHGDPVRPGIPADHRHEGLQGPAPCPGRSQLGDGSVAYDDRGGPGESEAGNRQGRDEADAGGVRPPSYDMWAGSIRGRGTIEACWSSTPRHGIEAGRSTRR